MQSNHKIIVHFAKNRNNSKQFPPSEYPWTIHYKGSCLPIKKVRMIGYVDSEWHPLKATNPRGFFATFGRVRTINGYAVIKSVKMPKKLRK